MAIRVRLIPGNREEEIDAREISVQPLHRTLGLSPDPHVVLVDGAPVTEDTVVREGSDVVIVRVLSGG